MLRAAYERLSAFATADEPLAPHTTYKLGGPAAVFATPRNAGRTGAGGGAAAETGLPVLVVGRGSNLLVADEGFAGVVVSLARWPRRSSSRIAGWVHGRGCGGAAGAGAALFGGRAGGLRVGGGRARFDRWGGAHERRRPRQRHGRQPVGCRGLRPAPRPRRLGSGGGVGVALPRFGPGRPPGGALRTPATGPRRRGRVGGGAGRDREVAPRAPAGRAECRFGVRQSRSRRVARGVAHRPPRPAWAAGGRRVRQREARQLHPSRRGRHCGRCA